MMKNIETMRTENGHFTADGKEYILIQPAYFDSDIFGTVFYSSTAICLEDEEDEDGYRKSYTVRWEIPESYNAETDSECACNWDEPEEIKECGEYSIKENRQV